MKSQKQEGPANRRPFLGTDRKPLTLLRLLHRQVVRIQMTVITSYSIHYTKLYEKFVEIDPAVLEKERRERTAEYLKVIL